ncbi:MAG: hypothetical protein ACRC1K_10420, partial [Planctomycetia bacterium]
MTPRPSLVFAAVLFASLALVAESPTTAAESAAPHPVYALVGARVVLEPGKILDAATVVVRNGVIEAVGADVAPPFDARVWSAAGKTIHAGFIDAGAFVDRPADFPRGANGEVRRVAPEWSAAAGVEPTAIRSPDWRRRGYTSRVVIPRDGVLGGQAAFVTLDAERPRTLREGLYQTFSLHTKDSAYPQSDAGLIAAFRSALVDAEGMLRLNRPPMPGGVDPAKSVKTSPSAAVQPMLMPPMPAPMQPGPSLGAPSRNAGPAATAGSSGAAGLSPSVEALRPLLLRKQRLAVLADTVDDIRRAVAWGEEFRIALAIVGGAEAGGIAPLLRDQDVPVFVRLD